MRLLLDTHFLIWLINDPAMLSGSEGRAFVNAAEVCVSAASLWELRTKWNIIDRQGRRKGVLAPEVALDYCSAQGWSLVPLEGRDALVILAPPIGHRDPFDEMLLVHAQRLGARLLTRDRLLRDHPLAWRA